VIRFVELPPVGPRLPATADSGTLRTLSLDRKAARPAELKPPAWRRGAPLLLALMAGVLSACGGGGGAGGDGGVATLPASSNFAGKCAPENTLARDGTGSLLARYTSGSLQDEKSWVRSYMDEAYLWYAEVAAPDSALPAYNTSPAQVALTNWFQALKTPALTTSGAKKDRFSFTLPTAEWNALIQSGVTGGYGIEWALASPTVPRSLRVAYTNAGTPAEAAGVVRGDSLVSLVVDGASIDFVNTTDAAEVARLNEVLFSPPQGRQATFRLRGNGGTERDVMLTAGPITTTPVKLAKVLDVGGSKVGYLLFNDFILPAEGQLGKAMEDFRAAAVSDLILDLRYNGGGYLYIASQLAYMIAPPARTAAKTFERSVFSDKRAAATNSASSNLSFMSVSTGVPGSGTGANSPLPNLGLNRVYVLTTAGTCSASESIVNGLRGVDVEVIVLGASTCGKPYGFTARDNCGLSYFPVEFQGVNQKGFGDFAEGFPPFCAVADDLSQPLGSESEGLLAAALGVRAGASCAAVAAGGAALKDATGSHGADVPGTIVRPASRSNKFLAP